jgi:hypothetical protein
VDEKVVVILVDGVDETHIGIGVGMMECCVDCVKIKSVLLHLPTHCRLNELEEVK